MTRSVTATQFERRIVRSPQQMFWGNAHGQPKWVVPANQVTEGLGHPGGHSLPSSRFGLPLSSQFQSIRTRKTKPLPRTAGAKGYQVGLENDLQTQLHVEGFSGTDTRSAIEVADSVRNHAAAWIGSTNARGQIDAVE